uniref:Reverse transcriptase domain-containing protein n=1 Tax=Tanacetum cinerariifolium TaxID=118510 RepID=A0A6L2M7R0_TANCI|nr:hypothetical protein [Tanacetum cinerariifolium]
MHVARECTYTNFLKCQPLNFKGNEGVVGLTQWIVSHEFSYGITWKALKKMMTDKYYLKELALMCGRIFLEESDEVEKYTGGLTDMIQGSVMASKPKTMQDAIEFAIELMDQKIHRFAERQAKNKRKLDNDNQAQQQPPNKQNVARAYSTGSRHYKSDWPELKNSNNRNQAEGTKARGMVYAFGGGETDQDLDDMEDDINA